MPVPLEMPHPADHPTNNSGGFSPTSEAPPGAAAANPGWAAELSGTGAAQLADDGRFPVTRTQSRRIDAVRVDRDPLSYIPVSGTGSPGKMGR